MLERVRHLSRLFINMQFWSVLEEISEYVIEEKKKIKIRNIRELSHSHSCCLVLLVQTVPGFTVTGNTPRIACDCWSTCYV
jgi:hypothetical protein